MKPEELLLAFLEKGVWGASVCVCVIQTHVKCMEERKNSCVAVEKMDYGFPPSCYFLDDVGGNQGSDSLESNEILKI